MWREVTPQPIPVGFKMRKTKHTHTHTHTRAHTHVHTHAHACTHTRAHTHKDVDGVMEETVMNNSGLILNYCEIFVTVTGGDRAVSCLLP